MTINEMRKVRTLARNTVTFWYAVARVVQEKSCARFVTRIGRKTLCAVELEAVGLELLLLPFGLGRLTRIQDDEEKEPGGFELLGK